MRIRLVAFVVLVGVALGGAYVGRDLILRGSGGGWSHEAGDAWDAERALAANFEAGRPNLTFVVKAREGDIDTPEVAEAARDLVATLESRPGITDIESYWGLGRPDWLRSEDGSSALISARLLGASGDYARRASGIQGVVRSVDDAIEVTIGGPAVLHADIQQAQQSTVVPLIVAALVSLALIFVFLRNWVATALVAATAGLAVALTLLGLWGIAEFREMPVLSVILGMAAAWSLASAGGLAVMARFIAERVAGVDRRNAVVATVSTAGRTVAIVSTVAAVTGLSLWILPTALLRSTGYALGLAGLTAGLSTLIGLGVMLAIVGVEVISPERDERDDLVARPLDRVSRAARRHPLIASVLLVAVLGPLLFAGLGIPTGEPNALGMSPDSPSRRVAQNLASQFVADEAGSPFVVGPNIPAISRAKELTTEYAAALSEIQGVVRVDSTEGSFVDGVPTEVPPLVTRRFRAEQATWFMVPVEGNPNGPTAVAVTDEIRDVESPYPVAVGGAAAREAATVEAVDGRAPWFALVAVVAMFSLIAWLLRGVGAALRATIVIVLMTAAVAIVTRVGFADGGLGSLLGFTGTGNLAAVGPPIAWVVSVGIAAVSLLFGWGAVRETFDATQDRLRSPVIALGATRRTHLQATVLLMLPFVPFLFEGWRTGKLIGAAAVATGVFTAVLGRFIALPAVTAVAAARLWPIDLNGRARRVYATTPAARRCIDSARGLDVEALLEIEPVVETPSAPTAPTLVGPATAVADEPHADEPRSDEPRSDEPSSDEPSAEEGVSPEAGETAVTWATDESAEDVADEMPAEAPESADAEPIGDAPVTVAAADTTEPVDPTLPAVQGDEVLEAVPQVVAPGDPAPEDATGADVTAEPAPAASAALAADEEADAGDVEEGNGDADRDEADPGSVDVASLTASVIAALESKVPFTTEIGKAFVANPANNLSRVMEAILRDASARGGEEVLVYGHASRDRYRWMVVDTGPQAENDADRAHTLAEAQRFIRRVGGVVDCRPEGEFTVFVVEIPMAS